MTPYYQHAGITIFHGDCREVLPQLSVADLLLTDPPYGNNYISRPGSGSAYGQCGMAQNTEAPDLGLCFSRSRNQIVWGGNYFDLPPIASWLVWDKRCDPKMYEVWTYADCELAWCSDGRPARIHRQLWNGWVRKGDRYSRVGREHPTQKPVDLMLWCLSRFPNAQTILDPFMGSGTTLRAAKDLGRQAIGIDVEERYCEIAALRLSQEVFQLDDVGLDDVGEELRAEQKRMELGA